MGIKLLIILFYLFIKNGFVNIDFAVNPTIFCYYTNSAVWDIGSN